MKQAIYKGVTYNVPLWTRWLAEDFDGTLHGYAAEPIMEGGEWFTSYLDHRVVLVSKLDCQQPVEVL